MKEPLIYVFITIAFFAFVFYMNWKSYVPGDYYCAPLKTMGMGVEE